MITKDGRDTPILKLTPDNYIVPKGEERAYHVVIEVRQFDPKTGARLSRPRVQKFGKKAFEAHVAESLRKQGYDLVILHDPNKWIAEQKAVAAERAKAKAEADKKAEQERFDAAVAAAVERALAEREKDATRGANDADGEQPQPGAETPAKGRKKAKEQE